MKKSASYVSLLRAMTLLVMLFASACAMNTSSSARTKTLEVPMESTGNASGVVEYVWEEPMVDTVEVPPGLDPEGHYYRPAHQSVVEVRQGRWKYYRQPAN